jgi:KDO2-lipid IV(A) lauroyltransferase
VIKLLSRTPLWALYGVAGCVYLLAYYVFRHRRHVIVAQLAKVFPDRSEAERRGIHRRFLKNYCQVMVEILKGASISEPALVARTRIADVAPVRKYLDAGQSVLLLTSHMANWEWLLQAVTLQLGFPVDAAYKPIRYARGERLMRELRTRFGARLVPAQEVLPDLLRRRAIVHLLAMNADQVPNPAERHHWTRFLGQDTAFYLGAEQIARATRLPIFYVRMRRLRRGFYAVDLCELWDGRERTEPGELTDRYARVCEADVVARPADWLWTYRRWRYPKPLYSSG